MHSKLTLAIFVVLDVIISVFVIMFILNINETNIILKAILVIIYLIASVLTWLESKPLITGLLNKKE